MTQPSDDRVVIDPEGLRQVGVRMRGGAALLSAAGRALATRPLPAMPPGIAPGVADAIRRANGELQDLAAELLDEAGQLFERATWAELGGTSAVAWLFPNLTELPRLMPGSSGLAGGSAFSGADEEGLFRSVRWAPRLLDELPDPGGSPRQDAFGLDDLDDGWRARLLAPASEGENDSGGNPLGALAMTAGAGLERYEQERARGAEAMGMGSVAADGALAFPVPEGAAGATLAGLIGCLRNGGLGASGEVAQTDE